MVSERVPQRGLWQGGEGKARRERLVGFELMQKLPEVTILRRYGCELVIAWTVSAAYHVRVRVKGESA